MIWGINKSLQRTICQYELELNLRESQKTRSNKETSALASNAHLSGGGQSSQLMYIDTEDVDNLQAADEEELLIIQRQRQVTMHQKTMRRKTVQMNDSYEIKRVDDIEKINLDAIID